MSDQNNPFNVGTFREELANMFDDKLQPITTLLDKHDKAIDTHEAALNRARGARWAFWIVWAGLSAAFEWLMHGGKH